MHCIQHILPVYWMQCVCCYLSPLRWKSEYLLKHIIVARVSWVVLTFAAFVWKSHKHCDASGYLFGHFSSPLSSAGLYTIQKEASNNAAYVTHAQKCNQSLLILNALCWYAIKYTKNRRCIPNNLQCLRDLYCFIQKAIELIKLLHSIIA